jgi:hypothetical protein
MQKQNSTRDRFSCLIYHEIGSSSNKFVISRDQFKIQLEIVISNNFVITNLENINTKNGSELTVFTFDDGNKSDLWAAEQLAQHGFRATYFIVKEFVEIKDNNYLSVDDILEIAKMGHSLGVHGKTHTWWTRIGSNKLIEELAETKKWIEDITGYSVKSCSAPGGKLNNHLIEIIKRSNEFEFLRNSSPKINLKSNEFEVNGIAIEKKCTEDSFKKKLQGEFVHLRLLQFEYQLKNIIKPLIGR